MNRRAPRDGLGEGRWVVTLQLLKELLKNGGFHHFWEVGNFNHPKIGGYYFDII